MKKARIIYQLTNDLLKYLLKYSALETFSENDVEKVLAESDRICNKYKNAPDGIGYLAYKMCGAVNSYFMQIDKRKRA